MAIPANINTTTEQDLQALIAAEVREDIRDCVITTGSFLGAWLWSISPQADFIGAAICGALGTVWFWWFVFCPRRNVERMVV